MTEKIWSDVDRYFGDLLIASDPHLEAALRDADAAGLPPIHVTPTQGKLLHILARIQGSRRILEIGTLAGYSTIWLARALPREGRVITLEAEAKHAKIAQANLERAGVAQQVEIVMGPALQSLPKLTGPFDFIFVDADKQNTEPYFKWALKLSRPGTVIVVDNVVRKGGVADAGNSDRDVQGIRRFAEAMSKEKRVTATAIQTVGAKGYDGFAIGIVGE